MSSPPLSEPEAVFHSPKTPPQRSFRNRLFAIAKVLAVVAVVVGGYWGFKVLRSLAGGGSLSDAVRSLADPRELFPGKDRLVILVLGKDYNHTSKGIQYSSNARADTIMILSADLEHKSLAAVSVPRDTKVTAEDGVTGKINAVFQRGGVDLLKRTLSAQLGVPIDHYVVLKSDAVKAIVDAVGGVEVDPIDDMFYEDSWAGLKIDLHKGPQRINGEQAVGFVRFRKTGTHKFDDQRREVHVRYHASKEEGDLRRTERQQELVRAVMAEAKSLSNVWRIDELINVGFEQIDTDLTRPQVGALANLFKSGASSNMASASLPGRDSMDGGLYYWELDDTRARATVDWLINGNELAGRSLLRVAVYNGTGKRGATGPVLEKIKSAGFDGIVGGMTRERPPTPEVTYRKAAQAAYASEVASLVGAPAPKKDTKADPRADWLPDVKVVLVAKP